MSKEAVYKPTSRHIRNVLLCLILAKAIWFGMFSYFIDPLFEQKRTIGIGLTGKDTPMYYDSMEAFFQLGTYPSICRMPGLLPVYLPFRALMDQWSAMQCVIIFQVVADIFTSWLVCLLAIRFFPSARVLTITTALLCAGSFVSIRSMYLLSDCLGISTLIASTFFLVRFADTEKKSMLFWSGLFLVWAIFLRQILILLVPVHLVIILSLVKFSWRRFLVYGAWLCAPIMLVLSIWTVRNRMVYDRTIILVAPLEECMTQLTPAYTSIRKFIIVTGKDFQPWTIGDAAHWFVQPDPQEQMAIPYAESDFTSEFNADSLSGLKRNYQALLQLTEGSPEYNQLEKTIIEKSERYGNSHKTEHAIRYLFVDKLLFVNKFLFPKKIDDLPLPPLSQMNLIQKGIKGWNLILLWIISALSLIGVIYALFTQKINLLIWAFIPFSLIAVHSYLGFIEQRYLAVSFPFMIIMSAAVISELYHKLKHSLNAQPR
jgi:hypothetical protein